MKKLISLIVLLIIVSAFGVIGVDQNINAAITSVISVTISPTTLDFGSVAPGTNNKVAGPIGFDATGSNVNVKVEVTDVTGNSLFDNIEVTTSGGARNIIGATDIMPCVDTLGTCTYAILSWPTTLDVPGGFPAGPITGAIVYTFSVVA